MLKYGKENKSPTEIGKKTPGDEIGNRKTNRANKRHKP